LFACGYADHSLWQAEESNDIFGDGIQQAEQSKAEAKAAAGSAAGASSAGAADENAAGDNCEGDEGTGCAAARLSSVGEHLRP
jgi:hypothetical protein